MNVRNVRVKNVSKIMTKIVKEKKCKKNIRIKIFRPQNERAQNVSVTKVWVKMWVKNVTLQNYESKKCCFKKSTGKKGNS